jgi:hypothetical protein
MSKSSEMRRIITKNQISVHEASLLPSRLLTLWKEACESLIVMLECERILITSSEVKKVVMDDILMAKKNLSTIKGMETLNNNKLGNIILN